MRSQAQRAEGKGQLYLFRRKVGHTKTPGAYNDRPKNRTQTVRRNTQISHPQNEQRNKPAQKPAGLLGLNSPQWAFVRACFSVTVVQLFFTLCSLRLTPHPLLLEVVTEASYAPEYKHSTRW